MMLFGVPPVLWASAALLLGVFVGSFVPSQWFWAVYFGLALVLLFVGTFYRKAGWLFLIACSVFAYGIWIAGNALEKVEHIAEWTETVSSEATIARIPKQKELYQEVVFRYQSCEQRLCPEWLVLARISKTETYRRGDRVWLSCDLRRVENFTETFDYRMYLAKEGVGYFCDERGREVREKSPLSTMFFFVERFDESLSSLLPEPESSLGIGILLGGDERFPEEARQWFRASGLAHIVALSGFNISVISFYFLLIGILLFLPRSLAGVAALVASGVLVFVAGMPPSGMRALGMAGTMLLALSLGRRYGSITALIFVAALMVLHNPLLLRYDIGFQLSALATLGIILCLPLWKPIISSHGFFWVFAEALFLTVSAQAFILPIIFLSFGEFSMMSFAANTALIPLIPPAMLFSFLAGVAGMVSPLLGSMFAFPAYALLHSITSGARFFAEIEFGDIVLGSFGVMETALWYVLLALAIAVLKRRQRRKFFENTVLR